MIEDDFHTMSDSRNDSLTLGFFNGPYDKLDLASVPDVYGWIRILPRDAISFNWTSLRGILLSFLKLGVTTAIIAIPWNVFLPSIVAISWSALSLIY